MSPLHDSPALADLLAREFPSCGELAYLNHAAVAPWPQRTATALRAFAEENVRRGAAGYPRWLAREQALREALCTLLNAPSAQDIALVKNTSEALSFVAAGLDWNAGDNIVTSAEEFPSNRIVWETLAHRGVALRPVVLAGTGSAEAALIDACDARTRLLTVSGVQFASGRRLDLERLGAHCRRAGILFCVDAIQAVGNVPFDVQTAQCDFAMADGHKWLLGPEGLGFFYTTPAARDRLRLVEYGWHMVEAPGDYDNPQWAPAATARRFECGSPNMLGIHALAASVSLLLETGLDTVTRLNMNNAQYLIENLNNLSEVEVVSPTRPAALSAIVSFRAAGHAPQAVADALRLEGVICACRGGAVRWSPDFYQPRAVLDRALDALTRVLRGRTGGRSSPS